MRVRSSVRVLLAVGFLTASALLLDASLRSHSRFMTKMRKCSHHGHKHATRGGRRALRYTESFVTAGILSVVVASVVTATNIAIIVKPKAFKPLVEQIRSARRDKPRTGPIAPVVLAVLFLASSLVLFIFAVSLGGAGKSRHLKLCRHHSVNSKEMKKLMRPYIIIGGILFAFAMSAVAVIIGLVDALLHSNQLVAFKLCVVRFVAPAVVDVDDEDLSLLANDDLAPSCELSNTPQALA